MRSTTGTGPPHTAPVARAARAQALFEFQLVALNLTDGGSCYNADEPPLVSIESPSRYFMPPPPVAAAGCATLSARTAVFSTSEQAALAEAQAAGLGLSPRAAVDLLPAALKPLREARGAGRYRLPVRLRGRGFCTRATGPLQR